MKRFFIFFIFIVFFTFGTNAANIDSTSQKIFKMHENKNIYDQAEIYQKYISQLEILIQKNQKAYFLQNIIDLENNIEKKFNEVQQEILQKKANIVTWNSLILKFNNSTNISQYIQKNKQKILDSNSVFIFRESENISSNNMKKITSEIKNISPKILIFIDQEWWEINRFVSFDGGFDLEEYKNYLYVYFRFHSLSLDEQKILWNLFWKSYYFPALWDIWTAYKKISKQNKQSFLEIVTYIELKNLQIHGINTHWFIADLDLWNPIISWYNRSFSDNILDYFALIDAYIQASKQTGVVLYAKHFPGHGSGKIDSHKNILDYSENSQYVENNLVVFEYFLENTKLLWKWVMVGHMFLDKNIWEKFHKILKKSDFIITDDLSMNWYKNVWKIDTSKIFTTKEILDYKNLIKVDTQDNVWIK